MRARDTRVRIGSQLAYVYNLIHENVTVQRQEHLPRCDGTVFYWHVGGIVA